MTRRPMAHRSVDPHTAPMSRAEKFGSVLTALLLLAVLFAACLFLPDRLVP